MSKWKAKIRGICSTALTNLLLDHGFGIVQPSVTMKERFGLKENDETPDLEVYDRQDRQGVEASGTAEAVKAFILILQSCLDDVIIRKGEAPTTLLEGSHHVNVEFPALSKKKLDEIRGSVTPTLEGHHYYKACEVNISSALDMAEKLLEKGGLREEVEKLLKQTIMAEYPAQGSAISIEHVKLDGKVFHLGKALIQAFNSHESLIKFRRVFEKKGIYDGLRTEKEPGDYALTEAKIGEWHFKTEYFSRDGRYKGTYINLNTPIELYPRVIRYVDLEVDVCIWPNGRVAKLDEDKLKEATAEGIVTQKLVKIVEEKLREILGH
jgi:protein associated with RNAse G/E